MTMTNTKCLHCNGLGELPKFRHIANGVCYVCGGKGSVSCTASKGAAGKSATFDALGHLRAVYATGASKRGEARSLWAASMVEPYDAYSPAPIDAVRKALGMVDQVTAAKARTALSGLGLSV